MSNKNRDTSQGVFEFEGPINIPENYNLQRAIQAAKRRRERIGNVQRIKGFLRRTDGLFVPHSGTENSAIIDMPENKARLETDSAKQRVYEKYEGSEDVTMAQVDLWAYFSSQKANRTIRQKYRVFRDEALINAARIGTGLASTNGVITRDSFTFDPEYRITPNAHTARYDVLAYNSILKYYIDLEAFIGLNPAVIGNQGQRKWPRMDHKHAYQERMERAHETLEPLADDLFAERVDEAYWSHFSRGQFWVDVIHKHEAYKRDQRRKDILRLGNMPLPPEYYNSLVEQSQDGI